MIEFMISFYVILICLLLLSSTIPLLKKINDIDFYSQDYIAIHQIRTYIASKTIDEVNDDMLIIDGYDKISYLKYDRNRIVITPGYQIMMQNINNAYFYQENKKIYLHYEREKSYEVLLYE